MTIWECSAVLNACSHPEATRFLQPLYIQMICGTYCMFTAGCYTVRTACLHPCVTRYIMHVYIRML
jgi:hypothetical protein